MPILHHQIFRLEHFKSFGKKGWTSEQTGKQTCLGFLRDNQFVACFFPTVLPRCELVANWSCCAELVLCAFGWALLLGGLCVPVLPVAVLAQATKLDLTFG